MTSRFPVKYGITRRAMLAGLPSALLASVPPDKSPKQLPRVGEFFRFLDPLTETPVVRLTSLASNGFITAPTNRFVSVKDRFLIFSSDRTGTLAPFQLNLHNGTLNQLAQPRTLDPESLCLNRKRTSVYLLDGGTLQEIALANRKAKALADGVSYSCECDEGRGDTVDFFIVRRRRLETLSGSGDPLAEDVEPFCLARPRSGGCLFLRNTSEDNRQFWYVPSATASDRKAVLLAEGKVTNPVWTADGQTLLFLRAVPNGNISISEIHAVSPEAIAERCIAPTTQYAAFSPNADTSVFVGASKSKAQPAVLLLLASVKREMALCEHRASQPAAVFPVFSPDSKRVYFQSDREGKSALYSVNVEALVETTAGSDL